MTTKNSFSTTGNASPSAPQAIKNKENVPLTIPHHNNDKSCNEDDAYSSSTSVTKRKSSNRNNNVDSRSILARDTVFQDISKQVLRHKLQKLRHLVIRQAISPAYLDTLFPQLLDLFDPQTVTYNGGIAQIKEWKISCYLEVMEGGVPCTNPNLQLLEIFQPLLDTCNDLFLEWYRQQHACNDNKSSSNTNKANNHHHNRSCRRLMTFVTRYTPNPGEQALLKHVDGAGKVDGSVVVALPIDRWSAPYEINSFEGYGGGITFWDGKEEAVVGSNDLDYVTASITSPRKNCASRPREIHYETRSGDIAFIDRAVWHQADPITKGTRWALVIFYKVMM